MIIPLDFLGIIQWLAFVTIVLFLTAEAVSRFGPAHGLLVDRTRLRLVAATTGVVLRIIVGVRVYEILRG